MKILSIDAWANEEGWEWNAWYTVGEISKEEFEKLTTNRKILKWFRDNEFLGSKSQGLCGVYDDQYNIVVINRKTQEPIFCIEYGSEY